jgi:hypothetical protein
MLNAKLDEAEAKLVTLRQRVGQGPVLPHLRHPCTECSREYRKNKRLKKDELNKVCDKQDTCTPCSRASRCCIYIDHSGYAQLTADAVFPRSRGNRRRDALAAVKTAIGYAAAEITVLKRAQKGENIHVTYSTAHWPFSAS